MATRKSLLAVVATGAGVFYFHHRNSSNLKELHEGTETLSGKMITKVKGEVIALQNPKLAPQFDGLDCFETFIKS